MVSAATMTGVARSTFQFVGSMRTSIPTVLSSFTPIGRTPAGEHQIARIERGREALDLIADRIALINSKIGSVKSLHDWKRLKVGQLKACLKGTYDICNEGPSRRVRRYRWIVSERKTCAARFDCRFAINRPLCDRRISRRLLAVLTSTARGFVRGVSASRSFVESVDVTDARRARSPCGG
jgi:hypothetical protein